tara:strand:- start:33 stop:1034 length:1002 start_codon:yes stop_codon:yes gene_type:complete
MVVRHLKYTIKSFAPQNSAYINIAKDLSAINRQLFRQARMYKVKSLTVIDNDQEKFVQVGIAPDTWAMRNAVKRAFARWNDMNAQVLQEQPSLKARWNDFKPYLSKRHYNAEKGTSGTIETPEDMNANNLQYGEWKYSTFEAPPTAGASQPDGYEVSVMGDHTGSSGNYTRVGLIQSYGDARGTVGNQEPFVNTSKASDDPLVNLLDAGTQFDEIAENIINEGDQPPYANGTAAGDLYVGARTNMPEELMIAEFNSSSQTEGVQRIFGFNVPLGIIRLDHSTVNPPSDGNNITVIVEVAEGSYKGVHSESLVDARSGTWASPSKGGKTTKRIG